MRDELRQRKSFRWARAALLLLGSISVGTCAGARDDNQSGDPTNGGTNNPDSPNQPAGTLTLTPADAVVAVDGKKGFDLQFHAVNKRGEDVTAQAVFSVDDDRLGYFEGATFHGRPGQLGKTPVRARAGQDGGSTSLTMRLETIIIAPGAPPDAPTKFGGAANAKRAPEIAYPPPGALVPPNINEIDIQFRPKEASLFEISISGNTTDLKIYTPCQKVGDGCAFSPDEATMKLLAQTGRGQELELKIRGSSTDGGGVGTSAPQALRFSENDMKGGIYYWAASVGGIARYDFGLRGKTPESYYDPFRAGAICAGCHALSRNGKRIAVGLNIPGPAAMRALDTGSRSKLFEVGPGVIAGSNFQAFSPEGKWLVTTENGGLTLRDGTSGMLSSPQPAVSQATMPDFSPDGKTIVYVKNSQLCIPPLCPNLSATAGSLFTVDFLGDKGFGTPKQLVASAGENNYYPSISPDGKFVVFNRSNGADSYDASDARVMVVPLGGGNAFDLASANVEIGNSWPKWSPFQHRFKGQTIMWLTFSSRRLYGLRPTPAAQLWMIPVDAAKLEKGMDSSYPPIRLPFQDLNTGNHIAQWVEEIDRAKCSVMDMTGCGPNEVCMDGVCKPDIR
ncbi:MAG: hypothetical protein U1A78_36390 [Polyangia bacterium]